MTALDLQYVVDHLIFSCGRHFLRKSQLKGSGDPVHSGFWFVFNAVLQELLLQLNSSVKSLVIAKHVFAITEIARN